MGTGSHAIRSVAPSVTGAKFFENSARCRARLGSQYDRREHRPVSPSRGPRGHRRVVDPRSGWHVAQLHHHRGRADADLDHLRSAAPQSRQRAANQGDGGRRHTRRTGRVVGPAGNCRRPRWICRGLQACAIVRPPPSTRDTAHHRTTANAVPYADTEEVTGSIPVSPTSSTRHDARRPPKARSPRGP